MNRLIRFAALLCLFGAVNASDANSPPLGQLPDEITPTHYRLHLELDPSREDFSGTVEIDATLKRAQKHIWLHGLGLQVRSVSARSADGDLIGSYAQLDDSGVAKLSFPLDLPAGELTIRIAYAANYGSKLEGLYKVIDAGQPYLFTQFESIFARQMFPGFDEPGFKTPFDVNIRIPKHLRVIFNTPIAQTELQGDWQNLRFATTKKLPTYLLAVVVGDIDIVDYAPIPPNEVRSVPIPLRGVATKGKGKLMQYALANTAATVHKLEQYFATPYPFEKLDLIAVPDFGAGAMENAGAITYREQLMLFKDDAPIAQKVAYTGTHAHELAHQWFGNLVTPAWWDDIWLNEAFATWMGLKIGGATQPSFNFQNRIQSGAQSAMELDSLPSARKIRNEVNDKDEIVGAFDSITYRKGGGVLMMFETYLGEEKFREGVRLFMRRHAYSNASAKDFLRALSDAANDPSVIPAFESFLTQNGVPKITLSQRCEAGKVSVKLQQSRYQPLGVTQASEASSQRWRLPLCLRYAVKAKSAPTSECVMLDQAEQEFSLQAKSCPVWVLPNAGGSGYLRFALTPAQWQAILPEVGRLSSAELLALHDALNAQLLAGEISAEHYLQHVEKLLAVGESDTIVASLLTLRLVFDKLLPINTSNQARARKLLQKQVRMLGIDPDPKDKRAPAARVELRARVLEFAVQIARDPTLRKQLSRRGSAFLGLDGKAPEPQVISSDLRELALAVSVQERGAPAIKALQMQLEASNDAIFRGQALRALGRVETESLALKLREYALAPHLRSNEVMIILTTQAGQAATSDAQWAWAQANLARILARLGEKSHTQVFALADSRCDATGLAQVTAFFADKAATMTNGRRALANTEQRIRRCAALVDKQRAAEGGLVGAVR